ncbi:flippase-like domain-containing protein [candidate division GN15 bacterium]|nr:flippase-like domain-containing protein [candidate division GN15 bacterium]
MTRKQKRLLSVAVGIIISIVLLWVVFHKISLTELIGVLVRVNYWWLVPNVALVVLSLYQRAFRWRYMLDPIKRVPYPSLLASTCIGFMANNVLPLRLGEFVRAYSLSRQDPEISKSASLATIFVERMVFDLMALLAILGGVFAMSTLPLTGTELGMSLEQGTYLAVGVALVGLIFVLFLAMKPELAGSLLVRYLFFLPAGIKHRIQEVVLRFSRGLEFMTDQVAIFWVGSHTLLIWIVMGLSNYFVFLAFGFELSLAASFILLVIVSISILIPSSPGFVGVYHAGVAFTLKLYGVPTDQAGAFALVLHAAQYIPVTAMGFYFLKTRHLSLKRLEEEAVEEM